MEVKGGGADNYSNIHIQIRSGNGCLGLVRLDFFSFVCILLGHALAKCGKMDFIFKIEYLFSFVGKHWVIG